MEPTSARAEGTRAKAGQAPAAATPATSERVSDVALASRLSFFLWATGPDAELTRIAEQGRLTAPGMLERQVARLLADPRAESLSTRFAAQWLRLADVDGMLPDAVAYPYYDHTLGEAFVRETELFLEAQLRSDRSIVDLLNANDTFLNEQLARHYRVPGVYGSHFRRVTIADV